MASEPLNQMFLLDSIEISDDENSERGIRESTENPRPRNQNIFLNQPSTSRIWNSEILPSNIAGASRARTSFQRQSQEGGNSASDENMQSGIFSRALHSKLDELVSELIEKHKTMVFTSQDAMTIWAMKTLAEQANIWPQSLNLPTSIQENDHVLSFIGFAHETKDHFKLVVNNLVNEYKCEMMKVIDALKAENRQQNSEFIQQTNRMNDEKTELREEMNNLLKGVIECKICRSSHKSSWKVMVGNCCHVVCGDCAPRLRVHRMPDVAYETVICPFCNRHRLCLELRPHFSRE